MVISRILHNAANAIASAMILFTVITATTVLMFSLGSVEAHAEIAVKDAAGREIHLASPARRIVFNDSLLLISLALIDPDPIEKIAGWGAPRRIDQGIYAAFKSRFPEIDTIPEVGAVAGKCIARNDYKRAARSVCRQRLAAWMGSGHRLS